MFESKHNHASARCLGRCGGPLCQLRWNYFYPRLEVTRPFGTDQVKFSGFDFGMRNMAPKMQPKANDGFQEQEQQLQAPSKPRVQDPTVFVESRTTGGAGSVA